MLGGTSYWLFILPPFPTPNCYTARASVFSGKFHPEDKRTLLGNNKRRFVVRWIRKLLN